MSLAHSSVCILAFSLFSGGVLAAPGDWDRSFGQDGRVELTAPPELHSRIFAQQPDGKVLVGGCVGPTRSECRIIRLEASGSVDPSFGTNGAIAIPGATNYNIIVALQLHSDGRIFAVLESDLSETELRIARLNAQGLDATFDADGQMQVSFPSSIVNRRLSVAADGGAAVVARLWDGTNGASLAFARITANGAMDSAFGAGGLLILGAEVGEFDPYGLAFGPDQSLFFAGSNYVDGARPVIGKVTAAGQLDESFGVGGLREVSLFEGDGEAHSVLPTADGGVIAAIRASTSAQHFIARLTAQGQLASTFGSGGRIAVAGMISSLLSEGEKIVAYGSFQSGFIPGSWLARFNGDGSTDQTFGLGGVAVADFSTGGVTRRAVIEQLVVRTNGDYQAVVATNEPPSFAATLFVARFASVGAHPGVLSIAYPSEWFGPGVTLTESDSTHPLLVSRTGGASGRVSVAWRTVNGSAIAGEDFIEASGVLEFQDGDVGQKRVDVRIRNDVLRETTDEAFQVELLAPTNGAELAKSMTMLRIRDDGDVLDVDDPSLLPVISISAGGDVAEGAGQATATVTLSAAPTATVQFTYTVVRGTAGAGDVVSFSGTWTFAVGGATTIDIPVTINNDALDEIDESFSVQLSSPQGALLGTARATFTIIDDDPTPAGQPDPVAPGVRLRASNLIVSEGDQTARFEVERVGDPGESMIVTYGVMGSASQPSDYLGGFGVLHWGGGQTQMQVVELQINGDTIAESEETLTLTLQPQMNFVQLAPVQGVLRIADDDGANGPSSTIGFVATAVQVGEGAGSATLSVARTGDVSQAASVTFTTSAGSASAADFTMGSGTIIWGPGDNSVKSITIAIAQDAADEPLESFTVTLSAPSASAQLGAAAATVTIEDDDQPAQPGGRSSSGGGGGGSNDSIVLLVLAALWRLRTARRATLAPALNCWNLG